MAWIIGFTPKSKVKHFAEQMQDISAKRTPRAVQFALNGIAIEAAKKSGPIVSKALDKPTAWSTRAFVAVKGNLGAARGQSLDKLWSAIHVKKQQSTVFKYLFGEGRNARRPGDVGMASKSILLPVWANLKAIGIKPTKAGNLPKDAIDRITAKAANGAFWRKAHFMGITKGDRRMRRKMPAGLYARPARIYVGVKGERWQGRDAAGRFTKDARPNRGHGFKLRNAGLPTLLLRSVPMTRHLGVLQKPIERFAGQSTSDPSKRSDRSPWAHA